MSDYKEFYGIYIKKDEEIVMQSSPSLRALIITWASIPALFAVVYLPALLTALAKVIFWGKKFGNLFGNIPTPIVVLISIPIILLVAVWFFFCLTLTHRHFRYHLAVTDSRVIGKAGGEELNAPLSELVNVFVEKSIWGKLLNYGAITVQTKKKTLTFYNVHSPKAFYDKLMSYAENYCAH